MSCADCSMTLAANSDVFVRALGIHRSDDQDITAITSVTAEIVGVSGSQINLAPVVGVDDEYQGTFPYTLGLVRGNSYDVKVSIVADGLHGEKVARSVLVK